MVLLTSLLSSQPVKMWPRVRNIVLLSFVVALFARFSTQKKPASKLLKVTIYYESLCPDSISFVADQLVPAYKIIGKYLDLDFVPYGKAEQNKSGGKWIFSCQHGPRECHGNKLQACGLNQNVKQDDKMNFVGCVMTSGRPYDDPRVQKCASSNGISWSSIASCMNSDLANELLAKYGERTHNTDPVITFVPTIVFNDVYNNDDQSDALVDFLYVACQKLPSKPEGCPAEMKRGKRYWWLS